MHTLAKLAIGYNVLHLAVLISARSGHFCHCMLSEQSTPSVQSLVFSEMAIYCNNIFHDWGKNIVCIISYILVTFKMLSFNQWNEYNIWCVIKFRSIAWLVFLAINVAVAK